MLGGVGHQQRIKYEDCPEFDCLEIYSLLDVIAGNGEEVQAQLLQVGDVEGLWVGVCYELFQNYTDND